MMHDCNTCKYCNAWDYSDPCEDCTAADKWEPQSNADRIRAMSDEELAEWISCNCVGDGYGNSTADWLEWLKQEVDDG